MELITLTEVKEYLRVDGNEEDVFLTSLIALAYDYLLDGVTGFEEKLKNVRFKEKAKICMKALIQEFFDNRIFAQMLHGGQTVEVNYIIRSIMSQMEYGSYEY